MSFDFRDILSLLTVSGEVNQKLFTVYMDEEERRMLFFYFKFLHNKSFCFTVNCYSCKNFFLSWFNLGTVDIV